MVGSPFSDPPSRPSQGALARGVVFVTGGVVFVTGGVVLVTGGVTFTPEGALACGVIFLTAGLGAAPNNDNDNTN